MTLTADQFAESLVRSGLLTAAEVEAFLETLAAGRRPHDGQGLAAELVRAGKLTRFQAAAVSQGRTKGLVFGEYVVLDKLGQGGMGVVLKAQHRRMKRLVAVKVLPPAMMRSPDAIHRFYREVEAAARLSHPNIVTAYDAGEHEGMHYFVMEFVDGQDLAALVKTHGPMPIREAVGCVVQAARGLEYAHAQGIVHRDIKPANLLLDKRGQVKILDMGLARIRIGGPDDPTDDRLTRSGEVMGTCDYMAPEQAEDTHRADGRSDIYSLGCTLYRLLTGRPPYTGETMMQVLLAHRDAPIPSLRAARPDVPEALDGVYQAIVAKRPEDRYQTMGEAIAALEASLAGGAAEEGEDAQSVSSIGTWLDRVSRARGTAPASALEETRMLRAEGDTAPPVHPAESARPKDKRALVIAGLASIVVVLLALVVLIWSRSGGGGQGRLVFDWPDAERAEAVLRIDGKEVKLPATGAAAFACAPGEHTVSAARPGFRPFEQTVSLDRGRERKLSIRWVPLPNLIFEWAAAERQGATLQIDGQVQDLAALAGRSSPGTLQMTLKPGPHNVSIGRLGYEPFEKAVQIVEGRPAEVRPVWKEMSTLASTEPKPQPPKPPAPEPPPAKEPEKPAVAEKPAGPEKPGTTPEKTAAEADQQKRREAETAVTKATQPVEDLITAWDFRGALAALDKLAAADGELAARVKARRNDVLRMGKFKVRIIQAINASDPPKKKSELMLRGSPGDVTRADESGLSATLGAGRTEQQLWSELNARCVPKLAQLAMDPASGDDWIAAGLFALLSQDVPLAERSFDKARSLGADIDPYLGTLALRAFGQAEGLLAKKEYTKAEAALAGIEEKYARTGWLSSNKAALAAARAAAKAGIRAGEAEKVYAEAVQLFEQKEFFDLRPLVDRLKSQYADVPSLAEADRKPAMAELEKAVSILGKRLTVRQDGKGDFTGLQAALDAAPAYSLIEIADPQPFTAYNEKIEIAKEGITLRGKKGSWPIITSAGPRSDFAILVKVGSAKVQIQRLVMVHATPAGNAPTCLHGADGLRIRSSVLSCPSFVCRGEIDTDHCLVMGGGDFGPAPLLNNTIWLGKLDLGGGGVLNNAVCTGIAIWPGTGIQMRFCTVTASLKLPGEPYTLTDSILLSVEALRPNNRIEHCAVSGTPPFIDQARPGKGCFTANPMFADPKNLDYRLLPASPCRGRASDGGDVGCRYTPEMIEICKVALELRRRGLITF